MIRKKWLISKFIISQPGKQKIVIHILPNISKSKGNQKMKFGHLIEYNMRIIFLGKSSKNVVEYYKTLFYKIKIEHISESVVQSFIQFVFIVCQIDGYPKILKLSSDHLLLPHIKLF